VWVPIFTDPDQVSLSNRSLAFIVSESVAEKVDHDRRSAPL
jgi:hypothetical protein